MLANFQNNNTQPNGQPNRSATNFEALNQQGSVLRDPSVAIQVAFSANPSNTISNMQRLQQNNLSNDGNMFNTSSYIYTGTRMGDGALTSLGGSNNPHSGDFNRRAGVAGQGVMATAGQDPSSIINYVYENGDRTGRPQKRNRDDAKNYPSFDASRFYNADKVIGDSRHGYRRKDTEAYRKRQREDVVAAQTANSTISKDNAIHLDMATFSKTTEVGQTEKFRRGDHLVEARRTRPTLTRDPNVDNSGLNNLGSQIFKFMDNSNDFLANTNKGLLNQQRSNNMINDMRKPINDDSATKFNVLHNNVGTQVTLNRNQRAGNTMPFEFMGQDSANNMETHGVISSDLVERGASSLMDETINHFSGLKRDMRGTWVQQPGAVMDTRFATAVGTNERKVDNLGNLQPRVMNSNIPFQLLHDDFRQLQGVVTTGSNNKNGIQDLRSQTRQLPIENLFEMSQASRGFVVPDVQVSGIMEPKIGTFVLGQDSVFSGANPDSFNSSISGGFFFGRNVRESTLLNKEGGTSNMPNQMTNFEQQQSLLPFATTPTAVKTENVKRVTFDNARLNPVRFI